MKKLLTKLLKWREKPARQRVAKSVATPAHQVALRHAEIARRNSLQADAAKQAEVKAPAAAKERRTGHSPERGVVEANAEATGGEGKRRRAHIVRVRGSKEAAAGHEAMGGPKMVAEAAATASPANDKKMLRKQQRRAIAAVNPKLDKGEDTKTANRRRHLKKGLLPGL